MCLTFVTAVIIILKHATFLHLSNLSQESALTQAEKDYHAVNMKSKIQKFLSSSPQNHSLEQVASFIEASDISLYILAPIYIISYQALCYHRGKTIGLNIFGNQNYCTSLPNSTRKDQQIQYQVVQE
jgi:hypothetical protein